MKEFIIWATNPHDGKGERPISEKVYNEKENQKRVETARRNGWQDVKVQIIDYSQNNVNDAFIKAINKK